MAIVLSQKGPPLPEANAPRLSELGFDLHLASSPRFDIQDPEAVGLDINRNNLGVLSSANAGLQHLTEQMDIDEDAVGARPSQESTHSEPLLTTHNFMLSSSTPEAAQSSIMPDSWQQYDQHIFTLDLNQSENAQYSTSMGMDAGKVKLNNSLLHYAIYVLYAYK